ncbi:MAG: hypothetical protein ACRD1T_05825, partial [Acidimicrobiia bacterium]
DKGTGQIARLAPDGEPPGWTKAKDELKLTKDRSRRWVRMHLLPERLGGPARGGNLVPARGPRTNTPFNERLEDPAFNSIPRPEKMIWYQVEVNYHSGEFKDFPSYIRSTYGGYEKCKGKGGTVPWQKRSGFIKSYHQNPKPPDQENEKKKLFINSEGSTMIRRWLKCPVTLAKHVKGDREGRENNNVWYTSYSDVEAEMKKLQREGKQLVGLDDMLKQLRKLIKGGNIDWGYDR